MSKRKSLQPWLDYFELLHTYEQNGYLEVKPEKHEAYITRAALCTIAGVVPMDTVVGGLSADTRILDTARRLRTYAAYLSAVSVGAKYPVELSNEGIIAPPIPTSELKKCMDHPFALHIVKEEPPHDVLRTLLLTRKRNWLGIRRERVEVINYS